jgi:hypothetical protein
MFAIGVGQFINRDELEQIASEPVNNYYYTVDDYNALETIKKFLAWEACTGTTMLLLVNSDILRSTDCQVSGILFLHKSKSSMLVGVRPAFK